MIAEAFNQKEVITENSFEWVVSKTNAHKYYFIGKESGKIYGHVLADSDVWSAVFDYISLGKYIDVEFAKKAVLGQIRK